MKTFRLLFIFTAALLIAVSCEKMETDNFEGDALKGKISLPAEMLSEWPSDLSCVQYYSLIGGQTIDMGKVVVGNDENFVYVMFVASDGNLLIDTHLYLGPIDEMPETSKSNPRIGWFPYATEEYAKMVIYKIDKEQIPLDENGCFDVAAHAQVSCELDENGDPVMIADPETGEMVFACEETAWGAGMIENEIVYAAKAQISIPGVGSVAAYGPGTTYADNCHWGAYFGYNFLDINNFSPITLPLNRYTGVQLGKVDITIEGEYLVFRFSGIDGNTIDNSYLFVGELYDLFSYSSGLDCPDYESFPYKTNEVKIALSEFPSEGNSDSSEFDGSRWGFYFNYCTNCE